MTAVIQRHARPARFRDWLPRRSRARTGQHPAVTAVHGAALAGQARTDFIVTGGKAVPVPDLAPRTGPVSVKTVTTTADGTRAGYDTQPWDASGFRAALRADGPAVPELAQRVPGSTLDRAIPAAEPLADMTVLARTIDGLKALPDTAPAPRHTGVSLAGLPDGAHPLAPGGTGSGPASAPVQAAPPEQDPAPEGPARCGGSWLAVITPEGRPRCTPDPLAGVPQYAGTVAEPDGTVFAGIYLGDPDPHAPEPGDRLAIESADAGYLMALRDAIDEAIAALTRGGPVVEQQDGAQATGGAA
jgi:hypothetical protein